MRYRAVDRRAKAGINRSVLENMSDVVDGELSRPGYFSADEPTAALIGDQVVNCALDLGKVSGLRAALIIDRDQTSGFGSDLRELAAEIEDVARDLDVTDDSVGDPQRTGVRQRRHLARRRLTLFRWIDRIVRAARSIGVAERNAEAGRFADAGCEQATTQGSKK